MGQEHKEYTWNLIAKKLTGEASAAELMELEILLRNNPELHYPMQTMTDLWRSAGPDEQKMAERAFNRHLDRMEELHIDFFSAGQETTGNPELDPSIEMAGSFGVLTANPGRGMGDTGKDGFPDGAGDRDGSKDRNSSHALENVEGRTFGQVADLTDNRAARWTDRWPVGWTFRRKIVLAASVLCLLAITGLLLFRHSGIRNAVVFNSPVQASEAVSEVFTRYGSRTNLVLPDSTQVWLNAGSRITYDKNYGSTLREVTLTGEAYFDVARNAGKPFIIHTARVDIKVLGTSFNVKSYSSDKTTETTLIRGSIEVSIKDRPTEKIILKPNEKLVVANDDSTLHRNNFTRPGVAANEPLVMIRKPTYETNTGAVIETSWVENKLIFQDEEFRDLARRMERWYGVSFRFTNPKQQEWRFTGNFQKETIQQALDALKLTEAFNYTIQENQITIYDR